MTSLEKVQSVAIQQFRIGYVYGIRQKGTAYLKIGKSGHEPDSRVRALQTGNPSALDLEFYFKTYNVDTAESYAHDLMKNYRVNGEWFYVPFWRKVFVERKVKLACGRASANLLDSICEAGKQALMDMYNNDLMLPCPWCCADLRDDIDFGAVFCDMCGGRILPMYWGGDRLFDMNTDVCWSAVVVALKQFYEKDNAPPQQPAPLVLAPAPVRKSRRRVTVDRPDPPAQP